MKLRPILLAAVLLCLSQLTFWAMVTVAERQARPADLAARSYVEFQVLDESGAPIPGGDQLKAVYMGTSGYRADAIEAGSTDLFSILFEVEDTRQQLALFMAIRENLKEVKVNWITVQPDVPLQMLQGPITSEPAYFLLPMNVLQKGKNILTISKEHEGMVSTLPEFAIGPAAELADAYRWKNRYLVDLPLAGVAILAFTIALCLAVNWPAEDQSRMRWLMVFLASCMAFTITMTFNPVELPLEASGGFIIAFQILIGLSLGKYIAHDLRARQAVHRMIHLGTGVAVLALGGLYLVSLLHEPWFATLFPMAIWRSFSFLVLVCIPSIIALCWVCAVQEGDRLFERMLLAVCLTTFAIDRLSSSFDLHSPFDPSLPISLYWSPIVGGLLGLGMILSLARQASEARKTVVHANTILAERLVEQDAELSRSYDAQKQMLERQVMLEERQRIVRDMHDGIGGQLLGLMMQVRGGATEPKVIEEGLQASIADLRLIVDAMDTAEESLAETLRSFEHRARAQIEAAGIGFQVQHGLDESQAGPGARPTLQILRILQESVTNAMRHSGASTISLTSRYGANGEVVIEITDDGKGIPESITGGRGMISMRSRAAALHGELQVQTGEGGTSITLKLPARPPASKASTPPDKS